MYTRGADELDPSKGNTTQQLKTEATMAKITIEIITDSAAFTESPGTETARVLRDIVENIDAYTEDAAFHPRSLMDANGKICGTIEVDEDEE